MTRSRTLSAAARPSCRVSFILATMAAIAFFMLSMIAHAADDKDRGLSDEDMACLKCHAKPDLEKTLGNGKKLSLYIGTKTFAGSVHGKEGCEGCHAEIDAKTHGKEKTSLESKRELSLSMMETCRDCHKKTVKQYEDSVHAALVQEGSKKAPLCSDCHDPHATQSSKDAPAHTDTVICQKCHESIDKAYTASVHGQAGDDALVCADCHHTHNVKAASLGDNMKKECISCHRDTATTHATWLPNTQRHLEAISCPACHSPGAKRRVNLRLYDGLTQQQASDKVGVPQFIKLAPGADANAAGLDSRALWSMLQDFNRDGAKEKTVLRGRLEVRTGVEAHQLAKKEQALKDCDTCHREGAESFQSVTISIAGPDGRPLRRDASKGVLNSIESIESVSGFYALGSTRIKLLDTLLALTVAAGILLPGAHLTAKWLSRRARNKHEAAAGKDASETARPDSDVLN